MYTNVLSYQSASLSALWSFYSSKKRSWLYCTVTMNSRLLTERNSHFELQADFKNTPEHPDSPQRPAKMYRTALCMTIHPQRRFSHCTADLKPALIINQTDVRTLLFSYHTNSNSIEEFEITPSTAFDSTRDCSTIVTNFLFQISRSGDPGLIDALNNNPEALNRSQHDPNHASLHAEFLESCDANPRSHFPSTSVAVVSAGPR